VETPAGCEATIQHIEGEFPVPSNAPEVSGAGAIALVDSEYGTCVTESGGVKYVVEPSSSSPTALGTYVLIGGMVTLPPVAGLPSLPKAVWVPLLVGQCSDGWVGYAGSLLPGGVAPGCPG
jgi:hypothetical protein